MKKDKYQGDSNGVYESEERAQFPKIIWYSPITPSNRKMKLRFNYHKK